MNRIVLASNNKKKVAELNDMLTGLNFKVMPQSDFLVESVPETGSTFVENAIIKARHAARIQVAVAGQVGHGVAVLQAQAQQGLPLRIGQAERLHAAFHLGADEVHDAAHLVADAVLGDETLGGCGRGCFVSHGRNNI